MKIAIDMGHNCPPDSGCRGIFPKYPVEDTLTRLVGEALIRELTNDKYWVYDVTPVNCKSVLDSLRKRVGKAKAYRVDLFVSIHFNCFNKKAHGTEVYASAPTAKFYAQAIVDNLAALGWRNRGVKDGRHLYVIKHTDMPSVLIEVCFCDNEDDMKKFDADKVAKAIAAGISKYRY